jgi:hypothetical protein
MRFVRYRRPSIKTILGITKAKKRIKKDLGITALLKPFRAWTNAKRRIKRKIGYESEAGRLIRDGLPSPGECLILVVVIAFAVGAAVTTARKSRTVRGSTSSKGVSERSRSLYR